MRYAPALLLLAACSTATGPAGPAGPQGEPGAEGPQGDVSALVAEVAGLKAQLAAVAAVKPAKVPHLVVAETGEDLGVMVGESSVWREDLGGELAVTSLGQVVYAELDCRGASRLLFDGNARARRLVIGPDRTILRPAGAPTMMSRRSLATIIGNRRCINSDTDDLAVDFVDTATLADAYERGSLAVELR